MSPTREQLLTNTRDFLGKLTGGSTLDELFTYFSTAHEITATEHGLPCLAPFTGRTFTGRAGPSSVATYFGHVGTLLTFEEVHFDEYIADERARKVCVRTRARFVWNEGKGKGQRWAEQFVFVFAFDEEAKIVEYNVWGDSGALYLAARGELEDKMKEFEAGKAD